MGRKKIEPDKKKDKLSITISKENYTHFEDLNIKNKSKLIEELLNKHFNISPSENSIPINWIMDNVLNISSEEK
jgi:hypothetical protein